MSSGRRNGAVLPGWLAAAAFLLALFILGIYLWRDLTLPGRIEIRNLPDVIVENISFKRTIGAREWSVQAISAEHDSGTIRAASMDISIEESKAERAVRLNAVSGELVQESSNMVLYSINGFLETEGRSVSLRAPLVGYDGNEDVWTFGEGVEAADGDAYLSGRSARIEPGGIFILEKGVEAHWKLRD
ncbi:MAG: hypothetical protein LBT08_00170 [Synergistaceae bacterium]|nr:hypothetical protein [Synergistaceae bacterium]